MGCTNRYRFENNHNDSVGSANGSAVGTPTFDSTNYKEGSYSLDGRSGHGSETGSLSLDNTFTIAFWWRASGVGYRWIAGNMQSNDGIFFRYESTSHKLRLYTGNGSTTEYIDSSTWSWTSGKWYHFCVAVDKTSGEASIFVDGVDKTPGTNTIRTDFELTSEWRLGINFSGAQKCYAEYDDVQFYDSLLDVDDADWLYDNPGDLLSTDLALSGDATIALTGSGDIDVDSELAGDATIAATGSGDLVYDVSLGGSATVSIDGTADLVTDQSVAGDGSIDVVGTADLQSDTELSGDATINATGSANLTVEADGDVSLSGSATIAADASADLVTEIDLNGGSTIALVGSADLSVVGDEALAGDATISLVGAANLTIEGDSDVMEYVRGTSQITTQITGDSQITVEINETSAII